MKFGDYLLNLREQSKITLTKLSELSGISAAQIWRIENGKRGIPKPETIQKLAPYLGVKYEEMMMAAGYYTDDDITEGWIKELLSAPINQKEAMRTIWEVLKKF